jgi:hypothetical protein
LKVRFGIIKRACAETPNPAKTNQKHDARTFLHVVCCQFWVLLAETGMVADSGLDAHVGAKPPGVKNAPLHGRADGSSATAGSKQPESMRTITGTQIARGAAASNLNASGQSGVATGGDGFVASLVVCPLPEK